MPRPNDRRYGTVRWKRVRLIVLRRDSHRCWVKECGVTANVADHIHPVYPGMADAEFYGLHNLRASCKRHNTARGVAARLERETAEGVAPVPSRFSVGRSVFSNRPRVNDWPLGFSLSCHGSRALSSASYGRRRADYGAG